MIQENPEKFKYLFQPLSSILSEKAPKGNMPEGGSLILTFRDGKDTISPKNPKTISIDRMFLAVE